jgi:ribosome-associated translation inhibitor RaiA
MDGIDGAPAPTTPQPGARTIPTTACQITFAGVDGSEPPRAEVRAWLEKLGPLTAPMTKGHVVIEAVDEGRKSRVYRVRMELVFPDGVVTVGLDHPSNGPHEDIYVAIRNAFRAARRQLERHAQLHPADAARPPAGDPGRAPDAGTAGS